MRTLVMISVLGIAARIALAQTGLQGILEGRIVAGESLAAVEGATIVVTDKDGAPVVASGITDANGRFRYPLMPGTYDMLAIFGDARWIHRGVVITAQKTTQVPGVLAIEPSEIITVHEKPGREHRPAHAIWSSIKPTLPYSDLAMNENIWAVGWMLLDVDAVGIVTGFRFLHRPGHDLEAIAEREVWALRFDPARDDAGRPMASKVLWKFEWPPFFWAKDHKLTGLGGDNAVTPMNHVMALRDAAADNQLAPWEKVPDPMKLGPGTFMLPDGVHVPPCRGKAPLNLESHEPLYRDCTPPDLANVNTEPLIARPPR